MRSRHRDLRHDARWRDERGAALVLALATLSVLATLAGALVLLASTEATIAARYRDAAVAFYAAEGALARGIAVMRGEPDWSVVVPPGGSGWRELAGGVRVRDAGNGLVTLQAEGRGALGASRVVEATFAQTGTGVRMVDWRLVR